MRKETIEITVSLFDTVDQLPSDDARLVAAAAAAREGSYAPYSNFNVGAAVLLDNGEVVSGSNQENVAYPSGLCAERVALFYAAARYPGAAVVAMAVCAASHGAPAAKPVFPCGACRQVLRQAELRHGKALRVIMAGTRCVKVVQSAKDLLPLCFDEIQARR